MSELLHRARSHLSEAGVTAAEVVAVLVLLLGAVALTLVVAGRPATEAVEFSESPETTTAGPTTAPDPGLPPVGQASPTDVRPVTVVVYVSGQVTHPGLVHLPDGARVDDAIAAAGGSTSRADLAGLNLARVVSDGEQIHVPEPGEAPPREAGVSAAEGTGQSASPDAAPLDLNQADAAALEALPGIGPVTAGRIVAHREQIGGFVDVTQLLEVPGIGPARLAELQRVVRVGP